MQQISYMYKRWMNVQQIYSIAHQNCILTGIMLQKATDSPIFLRDLWLKHCYQKN
jgi:hypothetical protein